jgi:3-deoxy-7-phosphoheptulonate synthase
VLSEVSPLIHNPQLKYGCSVTDACVDWNTTGDMIRSAHHVLRDPLQRRSRGE